MDRSLPEGETTFMDELRQFKKSLGEEGFYQPKDSADGVNVSDEEAQRREQQTYDQSVRDTDPSNRNVGVEEGETSDEVRRGDANQEEGDQQESSEGEGKRERKRKKPSAEQRIADLTYRYEEERRQRAREAEVFAQQRREQIDRLRAIESENQTLREQGLDIAKEQTLSALRAAKEAQDAEIETALQDRLTQIQIEQQRLRDRASVQEEEVDYYPSGQQGATYNEPVAPYGNPYAINEHHADWIASNPWADPTNPNYDSRMHSEAYQFSQNLDSVMRYNGEGAAIGSEAYYDVITDHMNKKYGVRRGMPDAQAEEVPANTGGGMSAPRQQQPSPTRGPMVAPVARQGTTMADQYMSKNPHLQGQAVNLPPASTAMYRNMRIRTDDGRIVMGQDAVNYMAQRRMHHKPNFKTDGRRGFLEID